MRHLSGRGFGVLPVVAGNRSMASIVGGYLAVLDRTWQGKIIYFIRDSFLPSSLQDYNNEVIMCLAGNQVTIKHIPYKGGGIISLAPL